MRIDENGEVQRDINSPNFFPWVNSAQISSIDLRYEKLLCATLDPIVSVDGEVVVWDNNNPSQNNREEALKSLYELGLSEEQMSKIEADIDELSAKVAKSTKKK